MGLEYVYLHREGSVITGSCCGAGYGLLVCMLSMLAGATVEWYRLRLFAQGAVLTNDANREAQPDIVDMSVFWQIPQYILVGLSEASPLSLVLQVPLVHDLT